MGPLSTPVKEAPHAKISQARRCPGRHTSARHAQVCANAKFVMLHCRDCAPDAANPCRVPWCAAVKKLLQHVRFAARCVFCEDSVEAARPPF